MEKYIYKITNTLNGYIYIGQAKNPKRRFQEHFSQGDLVIDQAMRDFGKENFTLEILEGPIENYNEREKYWISFYDSNNPIIGYNRTLGGEEPPILAGLDSFHCTHTLDQVKEVKRMLKETELSTKEISELTNYDETAVCRINTGRIWYDEKENYPLRPEATKEYKEAFYKKRTDLIIEALLNTNKSQKSIAEEFGVSRTTVTAINRGQNSRRDDIDYPIRKGRYYN